MPIRFRCAYCNQLMGIARRKAGSVVRCPTCSGQVVVPTLEEAGMSSGAREGSREKEKRKSTQPQPPVQLPGAGQLFEGNELDQLLEGAAGEHPSILAPAPGALQNLAAFPASTGVAPASGPPSIIQHSGAVPSQPRRKGLTLMMLAFIALLVLFAVGGAFGLGYYVGIQHERNAAKK